MNLLPKNIKTLINMTIMKKNQNKLTRNQN